MEFISYSILLFHKGGLVMYPLLVCSIVIVAIAVERFIFYRSAHSDIDSLLGDVRSLLKTERFDDALAAAKSKPGIAAKLLALGIKRQQAGPQVLEGILQGAASQWAGKLKERLNYLDTIVTAAPLLGLLGTVVGMIQSFSVMNVQAGQPSAITGGVGEALVATASGLCVALLSLLVHTYFSHQLDMLISDMELVCNVVLDSGEWGDER